MDELITLRGLVMSKYKTISDFANAVKWKRNKASRIINNLQTPTVDDARVMAECLNIDSWELFNRIFLQSQSTKRGLNNKL